MVTSVMLADRNPCPAPRPGTIEKDIVGQSGLQTKTRFGAALGFTALILSDLTGFAPAPAARTGVWGGKEAGGGCFIGLPGDTTL